MHRVALRAAALRSPRPACRRQRARGAAQLAAHAVEFEPRSARTARARGVEEELVAEHAARDCQRVNRRPAARACSATRASAPS